MRARAHGDDGTAAVGGEANEPAAQLDQRAAIVSNQHRISAGLFGRNEIAPCAVELVRLDIGRSDRLRFERLGRRMNVLRGLDHRHRLGVGLRGPGGIGGLAAG